MSEYMNINLGQVDVVWSKDNTVMMITQPVEVYMWLPGFSSESPHSRHIQPVIQLYQDIEV